MNESNERAPLLRHTADPRHVGRVNHKQKESILRALAIVFLVSVVAFFAFEHIKEQATTVEVCYSRECIRAAGEILNDIDDTVNPCDDFWAFTCGGYVKTHPIIVDNGYSFTFTEVTAKTMMAMRELLESDFNGLSPGNFTDNDRKKDYKSWRKLRDYYGACISLEEETINSAALVRLVDSITLGFEFPSTHDKHDNHDHGKHDKLNKTDFTRVLADLAGVGIVPFFGANVGLWQNLYGLSFFPVIPWYWVDQANAASPYTSPFPYKVQAAKNIYENLITHIIGSVLPYIDIRYYPNRTLVELVADVLKFEEKWIHVASAERLEHSEIRWEITDLHKLDKIAPAIEWSTFFDNLVPRDTKFPNNSAVYWPHTMKMVSDLIDESSPQTLMFTVIWRTIFQAWYSNFPSWKILRERINTLTGVWSMDDRLPHWEHCLFETMFAMQPVTERFFIYDVLDPHAKYNIDKYVGEITAAYLDRFKSVEWVKSSSDKDALIGKLEATTWQTVTIGKNPDITSADAVYDTVKDLPVSSDSYVFNSLSYIEHYQKDGWKKLGKPYEMSFKPPTWIVNAFNDVYNNEIIIPGGIVQKPWYFDTNQDYLNFGGIGTVLGHELGHGFDQYFIGDHDKDGKKTSWISPDVVAEVERRAQCLIDQNDIYDKVYIPPNQLVCDQAGLRQSFTAWTKRRDNRAFAPGNRLLPGLDLTREQLFYVAYGRSFCGNIRVPNYQMGTAIGVNPVILATRSWEAADGTGFFPTRPYNGQVVTSSNTSKEIFSYFSYRVNMGVRNLPGFAETFSCPVGSKMNPKDKCEIW